MWEIFILAAAVAGLAWGDEVALWPEGAPGSENRQESEKVTLTSSGERVISNIHRPSITPHLPTGSGKLRPAVIVAPGGGHKELWSTHEGDNVAAWLASRGIPAFVLKYRLAAELGSPYSVDNHAVADLRRAIRLVRSRADEWGIDPSAVGVLGFSAGGEVCAMAAMNPEAGNPDSADVLGRIGSRPDFQALIYPGRSSRIVARKDLPPAFLAASANDRPDISEGLAKVYLDFKRANVPVELHLYASGGHGFGLRAGKSAPVDQWIERFEEWLRSRHPVPRH